MFFDTWHGLLRVLVVGTLAYIALVFFLRVSGKRTLTKMNAATAAQGVRDYPCDPGAAECRAHTSRRDPVVEGA